jgi:PadR family transcriptional regulator PadR
LDANRRDRVSLADFETVNWLLRFTLAQYIPYIVEEGESRLLGRFEEAVLLALINAKGEATIADIYEALADKLRRVSFGAIYTTLDRMTEKKFVERRRGESLPERGGKARYYYKIRSAGRAAVIEARSAMGALYGLPTTGLADVRRG